MKIYEFTVKKYMTMPSTPDFEFMKQWNNDIPMPLRVMTGTIEKETKGMSYIKVHGDLNREISQVCMKCGKPITNDVSKYFGLGPECGNHKYINPFKTKDELQIAVDAHKKQLQRITWEGWVVKSAITSMEVVGEDDRPEFKQKKVADVTIDKSKKVGNDFSIYLKIGYDDVILAKLREFAYRSWDKENKTWELDYMFKDELFTTLKEQGYTIDLKDLRTEEQVQQTVLDNTDIDYEFKTKPFKHQVEGFEYGLTHDRWLLADSPGLGKSKQVCDIACAMKQKYNFKHVLIICGVNGLKWNWQEEILTHTNETGHILGQRTTKKGTIKIGSTKDKLQDLKEIDKIDSYFLITNVETLRDDTIVKELQKLCNKGAISMIAADESHHMKAPSAAQSKGFMKLQPKIRIAMTGTPVMNQPLDLYVTLKWLGYETHPFYSFKMHYCVMGGFGGHEVMGYRNLKELRTKLDTIMLRRLKEDVLDLPDKLFIDEYVEMTPKQGVIYKEVTSNVQLHLNEIKAAANPLSELIRLRQATGYTGILSDEIKESAKLDRMEEIVEESVQNNQKVVIFSNWTSVTNPAFERLKKYNPRMITGETKDEDRQKYVNEFQNDDSVKVIIGTIGAMGTGITLHKGTVEIFLDEPWNMANKQQAIDRCHRIGQKSNVTIYTILCKNTIDEKIHNLVSAKGEMADALVDGVVKGNRSQLVDYLLS